LQILLDVPALSEDGLSSYTTILADENWYPAPEDKQGGGFVSVAENWSVFCNDETQETLTVQTSPLPSVQASMRLSLYTMDHYMCAPRGAQSVGSEYDVIPTLKIPAGAFLTSGGSSSGDGNAESSSEIRTTLTPMDLSIHFSDQLENDGWQRLDGDNTENFSWTSWKFTDSQNERWQGTLLIIDDPVDDELVFALIRMVKGSK
jgi:hypothetical protein